MNRRIVITGLGVITPIGVGMEAFQQGLLSGKCGIARLSAFDPSACQGQVAGEVKDFDPKDYIKPRKALKVMARDIQLAVSAAAMAMADCKVQGAVDPTRMGVSIGAGFMSSEVDELGVAISHACSGPGAFDIRKFGAEGMGHLFPLWLLKYLPNMLACHISIIYDAQGPNNTVTTACAAGAQAIGEGCRVIERGAAEVMICGSADSKINPVSWVRYMLFSELSERNEAPEKACRPFDRDRCGMVIGEGAGIVVVEELSHALKRGARIYAEIVGYGTSCDVTATNGKARTGEARADCMLRALKDANLCPESVDYISACGLGTRENDRIEADALRRVLGDRAPRVPVSSMKSMMGHLGAGAGSVELAGCVVALARSIVPPTLNCDRPDDGVDLDFVPNRPREAKIDVALSNTASFAGQNAAIVIKKFSG